jgi:hypothetical protein
VVDETPVPLFVRAIVAPTIFAPELSLTVPVRPPVAICAWRAMGNPTSKMSSGSSAVVLFHEKHLIAFFLLKIWL